MIIKALSIQQPWAWLIVNGHKDIENRSWKTKFRGEFYIHAGKFFDVVGYDLVRVDFPDILMPGPSFFDRGGIVGKANLVDVVTKSDSEWFFGKYGFVLGNATPLPLIECKGRLGFFGMDVPANGTIKENL